MSYIKTLGIVIKQSDVGEGDRILTLLTETAGKIRVWAKGARKPRSKLLASSQLFCASNFVIYRGRDSMYVSSAELVEPFFNLGQDMEKLTCASYLLQLVDDAIQEEQKAPDVLRLLLNSLHFIANTDRNPRLLVHIFELRFTVSLGFMPSFAVCSGCGRKLPELVKDNMPSFFYNTDRELVLCGDCGTPAPGLMPLSPGTAMAIYHIITAPMEKIFSFNVDDKVLKELSAFCRFFVSRHLEREYNNLDFLRSL